MRSRVIEHERQDELLDHAESVEIAVAANLIEQNLLLCAEKIQRLDPRQRLGHERFSEIEAFVAADDVFNSPVSFYGRRQSFLVVVISCEHGSSIRSVSAKHCGTAALQLESCAATVGQTMLVRPKKLTQRPAGTMSLPRVRHFFAVGPESTWMCFQKYFGVVLKGALYFNAEFSAPWGFNTPPAPELAELLAQDAPHLVIYHFVVEGSGFVRLEGDVQIELNAGDVVVVTHGDSHEMCSAVGVADRLSDAMKAKLRSHDLTAMQAGGGGDVARFVCGFMVCDPL